jgi:uncharacterized membrane protein
MIVPEVLGDHYSAEQRTSNFVTSVVEVRWIRDGRYWAEGGMINWLSSTVYYMLYSVSFTIYIHSMLYNK